MPRKNLIRTDIHYYHITTRANHKQWFALPLEQVWRIAAFAFKVAQENHPAIVSQFVLMNNHYHLLIRTPNCDIDKFMYFFNKEFSRQLRQRSGLTNRMFGGNYKWSIINTQSYLANVFRYIYQNPIRAGLSKKCETYKFSTLYYSYHKFNLPFQFSCLDEFESELSFLNEALALDQTSAITRGLRKTIFKEVKQRYT